MSLSHLTFKGKLVELSSHVVDHHPPAVLRPEPHHFFYEVRHHHVDGVAVGGDVLGLQHPGIQDAADALPLGPHSAKPGGGEDEDVKRNARQRHGQRNGTGLIQAFLASTLTDRFPWNLVFAGI